MSLNLRSLKFCHKRFRVYLGSTAAPPAKTPGGGGARSATGGRALGRRAPQTRGRRVSARWWRVSARARGRAARDGRSTSTGSRWALACAVLPSNMFHPPPPHMAHFAPVHPGVPGALVQARAAAPSPPAARAGHLCAVLRASAAPRARARARVSYWLGAGAGLRVRAADRAAGRPASCSWHATEICYAIEQPGGIGMGQRPSRTLAAGALRGTHEHAGYCTGRTELRLLIAVCTVSVCIADGNRAFALCSGVQLLGVVHVGRACFPGMDRAL